METAAVQSLLQQAATLSAADKLTLAEQLRQQAQLDQQQLANGKRNDISLNQFEVQSDLYRKREMQWISEHSEEYAGQYVALDGDRLVSHGYDPQMVANAAKAAGVSRPLLARMDTVEDEHFAGW